MNVTPDWYDMLQRQLGAMYQLLLTNDQLQELFAEAYGETKVDKYCDMMQQAAEALPVTIGVGDQLITMPNVAPVFNAFLSLLIALAKEYMIDLPETKANNEALRDLAQRMINDLFNS